MMQITATSIKRWLSPDRNSQQCRPFCFPNRPSVSIAKSITMKPLRSGAIVLFGLAVIVLGHQTRAASAAAEQTADVNAALIRGAYEAFDRGDIASVFAMFAQDIVWHVPGRGPLSREYRGHNEVRGFFERFIGLSSGTFRIHIDEILAKDDRVVVLCTETAKRAGRAWSSPQVHVWTVKDGRAIAFWEFEGDQQGEDEFWSIRE